MVDYIKSPLNYTGGKYKLLPQILPLFPDNIKTFVDLFGGGFNVGINVEAESVLYNDTCTDLCNFIQVTSHNPGYKIDREIKKVVEYYGLSKENEDAYYKLRTDYNKGIPYKFPKYAMFFALVAHSFSNQIRYNKKGEFNLPFGKRTYNNTMQDNLLKFVNSNNRTSVWNADFSVVCDFVWIGDVSKTLVYADPPYLLSTASYNENGGWTEKEEFKLYKYLEKLNDKKVRFALSNVTEHKGKINQALIDFSSKYKTHYLSSDYNNSNYHSKAKENKTIEVLITNY